MKQKKKKAALYGVLGAALLLFTAVRFSGSVRAEETRKANTEVRIMIYGNRNNVEFRVREENGRAVQGASVEIRNGKGEWLFYGTTDVNGIKSLWMPLSTQEYRVYKAGYESVQGKFKINSLLSKLSVKVVLKKTKTPDTKPEPKPTPKPKPTPRPDPGGNGGGSTEDGGSTSAGNKASGPGPGSAAEGSTAGSENEDSSRSKPDEAESGKKEEKKEEKKQPEERAVQEAGQYGERVDLAVNVYKTDGGPAAGAKVELHSDIWIGTLNDQGFILFRGVEMGDHVLYVKNRYGKILARDTFTIRRSNITAMESDNIMTVGIAVSKITLNLEYGEDGEMKFQSVWEGLNDRTGKKIEEKDVNEARKVSANTGFGLLNDIRFWISIAVIFLLFLCGYWTGKRRERKRLKREAKKMEQG